jgi:Spy/CpxP family protein refolding chaperone
MRKAILATMLAVTGVSGLLAQGGGRSATRTPPTPEQMVERRITTLTTLLTLDADQQAQAKRIFANEATAAQGLRDKAREAQEALQAATKATASDSQIDALAAQVGSIHGQTLAIHAKAQSKFRAILNSAQKEKLDTVRGNFGEGRGFGGPGGPGRMGPPPRF